MDTRALSPAFAVHIPTNQVRGISVDFRELACTSICLALNRLPHWYLATVAALSGTRSGEERLRRARPIYLLFCPDRRRLKERIHGRPRSDRKKRFLLSAVAPSTSTRHPRKARPINWA